MEESTYDNILSQLPYTSPFLFVDALHHVSAQGIKGSYTFKPDEFFYRGHFKNRPVTPGVLLIECMAQIGLVAFGIYLLSNTLDHEQNNNLKIAFSSTEVDFYIPVLPGEKVMVVSEKQYFRFGKLKCLVKMFNEAEQMVCKGTLSGMFVS